MSVAIRPAALSPKPCSPWLRNWRSRAPTTWIFRCRRAPFCVGVCSLAVEFGWDPLAEGPAFSGDADTWGVRRLICGTRRGGRWELWSKHQATFALRQIVSLVGLKPEEYALHSVRIGGATRLAAAGASPDLLRQEGRWAGERGVPAIVYVRSHGKDAKWVSNSVLRGSTRHINQKDMYALYHASSCSSVRRTPRSCAERIRALTPTTPPWWARLIKRARPRTRRHTSSWSDPLISKSSTVSCCCFTSGSRLAPNLATSMGRNVFNYFSILAGDMGRNRFTYSRACSVVGAVCRVVATAGRWLARGDGAVT